MTRPDNETRQRILKVADKLFSTRGYASVRLRDIADEIGIKHAALYYYAPGGKEQLYMDVMARSFERHQVGMREAIAAAEPDIRVQLWAVVDWLLAHPPVNVARMEQSDFTAIKAANAAALSEQIYDALRLPLREALTAAQARGDIALDDADLAAVSFVTLVEAIHGATNPYLAARKRETIDGVIEMLLKGWLPR